MNINCVHHDIPQDLTLAAKESSHPPLPHMVVLTIKVWRTRTPFLVCHLWILDWLASRRSVTWLWYQLEDRLGDQRVWEWMGADKNSSPMRELGLCPKFTNKDSHTSLPRSRSHNGPTNPRNKPQIIPKRKHDSRSKGLSRSARHQAGRLQALGGPSARPRRTVQK
jgi:hypothetical protein